MLIRAGLAALACLAVAPAAGQGLYGADDLARARQTMGPNIVLVVTEDIPNALPRAQRAGAARLTVDFIDRGPHPLSYYSEPAAARVIVPLESVLFLDDLAIATAWFEAQGCDAGYLQAYLAALLGGEDMPPPLAAFGIDRQTALADPFVDDVSAKILSTVVNYLMAHEVGHVLLGHVGGLGGGAESQGQEIEADAFALDFFTATGTPPLGMAIYFNAARWLDPADTDAGTHPVSRDRLRAISERLAGDPGAFASGYSDPVAGAAMVAQVADDLAFVADFAAGEERDLLGLALAREYPLSRLASACPG